MDTVICKELIITTLTRRGDGRNTPIRAITEFWDKDGNKLAENDSYNTLSVSKDTLQDAMMGSDFIKTGSEFEEWFTRNFLQ